MADDADADRANTNTFRDKRSAPRSRGMLTVRPSPKTDGPSVAVLLRAKAISKADLDAAVIAFLADPSLGVVPLGASGYSLDVAAAVGASRSTKAALKDAALGEKYRRMAVKTAILLAIPTEM